MTSYRIDRPDRAASAMTVRCWLSAPFVAGLAPESSPVPLTAG